jgi:hypothetical protein
LANLVLAGAGPAAPPAPADAATSAPAARIEFFFEGGCANCHRVENEILPELAKLYGGHYNLERFDIGNMTNYLRLAGYQQQLGCDRDEDVSMVVNGRVFLNGIGEIRGRLFETVDLALAGELAPAPATPATVAELKNRVRNFTLAGVLLGGLQDGINPCAIGTLVFFMSLLAQLKISGRRLWLAGGAFCCASFLAYFAIGLGLLRVLHATAGFPYLRAAIDLAIFALLLVFAGLSFRDAWRYRQSGDPNQLSLRLPRPILLMTHALMRRGLESRHLVLGGFGIGLAVTVLESVCTGQVYVPTLALVLRSGSSFPLAAGYLALYNFMFILPLLIILGLTWQGLKTETLLAWSRRNVVFSKCLLGLFFLGLAALLVWL